MLLDIIYGVQSSSKQKKWPNDVVKRAIEIIKYEFSVHDILESVENPEVLFSLDLDDELMCLFLSSPVGF